MIEAFCKLPYVFWETVYILLNSMYHTITKVGHQHHGMSLRVQHIVSSLRWSLSDMVRSWDILQQTNKPYLICCALQLESSLLRASFTPTLHSGSNPSFTPTLHSGSNPAFDWHVDAQFLLNALHQNFLQGCGRVAAEMFLKTWHHFSTNVL